MPDSYRIRECRIGRLESDESTCVLVHKDDSGTEHQFLLRQTDVANVIAGLITSAGQSLKAAKKSTQGKVGVLATNIIIPTDGIGSGQTASGPAIAVKIGGLVLYLLVSKSGLLDMCKKTLDEADKFEESKKLQ